MGLRGHTFEEQYYESEIWRLALNLFLNGHCGISGKYKEKFAMSYNGNIVNIRSGIVCIQGGFIEEESNTDILAGNEAAYCSLVIEVDLSKKNTESLFLQGQYKIVKGLNNYPTLIQNDLTNGIGIYQYELARFKTSINGITDFKDMRTYLDFDSIYTALINKFDTLKTEIQNNANGVLQQIQSQLDSIVDRSGLVLSSNITTIEGSTVLEANSDEGMQENRYKQTIIELDYPNSFNKDNCKMISFGGKFDLNKGYAYGIVPDNSSVGAVTGAIPRSVILQDKIRVQLYNWANIEKTYYYEITLMKK